MCSRPWTNPRRGAKGVYAPSSPKATQLPTAWRLLRIVLHVARLLRPSCRLLLTLTAVVAGAPQQARAKSPLGVQVTKLPDKVKVLELAQAFNGGISFGSSDPFVSNGRNIRLGYGSVSSKGKVTYRRTDIRGSSMVTAADTSDGQWLGYIASKQRAKFVQLSGGIRRVSRAGLMSKPKISRGARVAGEPIAFLSSGPSGSVWYSTQFGAIGRLAPDPMKPGSYLSARYESQTDRLGGFALAPAPDGSLWFLEPGGASLMHAVPMSNGTGFEISVGATSPRMSRPAVGRDGHVFVIRDGRAVLELAPDGQALNVRSIPTRLRPGDSTAAPLVSASGAVYILTQRSSVVQLNRRRQWKVLGHLPGFFTSLTGGTSSLAWVLDPGYPRGRVARFSLP